MDRWEYMVLEQPAGATGFVDRHTREPYPGSLESVLNAVGGEGWQLMGLDHLPDGRLVLALGRKAGQGYL